jgi:hypothetical protein
MVSTLHDNDIPVHCAQPRAVHYFARARKATAKSDPIDAETIMLYGLTMDLKPDRPLTPALKAVKELAERRDDLRRMLVAEKNRLKKNEQEMAKLVESEPSIKHPIEILTNGHGVGLISAITIYAAMIVRFNTLLKVMYQEPLVNPVAS